jgi:hypothetical protein
MAYDDYGIDEEVSLEALCGGDELLRELAAAVDRGDCAEANLLLDKIADRLGPVAQEAVAAGRFMRRPGPARAA